MMKEIGMSSQFEDQSCGMDLWVTGPDLQDFDRGTEREWLVTNGIGGFASSTVIGANTRRYHGLLVAGRHLAAERMVMLSKLEEAVFVGGTWCSIAVNQYRDGVYPKGYLSLWSFKNDPVPTFTFKLGPVILRKRIAMVYGVDATIVEYTLLSGPSGVKMRCHPLVAIRGYHHLNRNSDRNFDQGQEDGQVLIKVDDIDLWLRLAPTQGCYHRSEGWYRNLVYGAEQYRGLDATEDLFQPGYFEQPLHLNQPVYYVAEAAAKPAQMQVVAEPGLFDQAVDRRRRLIVRAKVSGDARVRQLLVAADAFLVQRKGRRASIIAGYPWFTDWGRDAMIALPGLTLATGRFEEAREILATFGAWTQDGLIPNRFPDLGDAPEYNTVDAPLWFFFALERYVRATDDYGMVEELWPVLWQVVEAYRNGTRYGIGADSDGLIAAGQAGVQLTWMDAKVGDWVVTPRVGKPVEINALWYNALKVLEYLGGTLHPKAAADAGRWARQAGSAFASRFWNEADQCLYDVVDGPLGADPSIRPNQIFAVSLPWSVLTGAMARAVVDTVQTHLLTPFGLRSLTPDDPGYLGRYGGDQTHRDAAYHQGIVWAWLIGPFITAYLNTHGRNGNNRKVAAALLEPLLSHLGDHGLGYISEIFDADPPFRPRGCFAQAWSVAEILRIWHEEELENGGEYRCWSEN